MELLERLINSDQEQPLAKTRAKATALLKAKGLPTRKTETYKYTHFSKILSKNFEKFEEATPKVEDLKELLPGIVGTQLVILNGVFNQELSSPLPNGVQLSNLEHVQQELSANASDTTDEFALLNLSNLSKGIAISVDKNTVVEAPIYMVHITDSSQNQAVTHPYIHINIAENAHVSFVEEFKGKGDALSFTNAVTQIFAAHNSRVTHIKLGNFNDNQLHVGNTMVQVQAHAVITSINLNFGGKMVRNNIDIELNASASEANLYGLYLPTGKEHIDNHTIVNHKEPHCNSNELYKGVLNEQGKAVFNGQIYVQPDAQKTNAFQSNKNIVLSDDATINTKPQLEIWADDVKCSHGCTTGKLDDEQLFYLKSRGIGQKEAITLLLHAFAGEVIEQITNDDIRAYVYGLLNKKLAQ